MDRNFLIKSASKIQPVSLYSAEEFWSKFDIFLTEINKEMCARPDINQLVGENNIQMMKDNHANHLRFMHSMFKFYNPEVFVDTVLWVFRAYQSHGFKSNYWAAQSNAWINLLLNNLSLTAFSEIFPYYEWIQVNIPLFVKLSHSDINLPESHH